MFFAIIFSKVSISSIKILDSIFTKLSVALKKPLWTKPPSDVPLNVTAITFASVNQSDVLDVPLNDIPITFLFTSEKYFLPTTA